MTDPPRQHQRRCRRDCPGRGVRGRRLPRRARAHRRARPGAARVQHASPPSGRSRARGEIDRDPRPLARRAARRRAGRAQGQPLHARRARRPRRRASSSDYVPPYDATVVDAPRSAPARSSSARPTATSSRWARRPRTRRSARRAIRGRSIAFPADRAADRRRRWRRGMVAARARLRHRRIDPPAGRALRRRRPQADLRPRLALRPARVRVVARSDRPAGAHGRTTRRCALGVIAGRDPARRDERRASRCPTTRRRSTGDVRGAAHRRAARAARRGRRRRGRARVRRGARRARGARRDARRRRAAARAVRDPGLLPRRARPRRARTWRATTACATAIARPSRRRDAAGRCTRGRATQGFGAEVKRRIMLGTYVLSAGYYDAYYLKAQQVRTLIRRDYDQAFAARRRRRDADEPDAGVPARRARSTIRCRCIWPTSSRSARTSPGLPAISVPCGFTADRLPIGLQLTGRPFDEATLLRTRDAYERLTEWSTAPPGAVVVSIRRTDVARAR